MRTQIEKMAKSELFISMWQLHEVADNIRTIALSHTHVDPWVVLCSPYHSCDGVVWVIMSKLLRAAIRQYYACLFIAISPVLGSEPGE